MRMRQLPAIFLIAISLNAVILTFLACALASARKFASEAAAGSAIARRSRLRRKPLACLLTYAQLLKQKRIRVRLLRQAFAE
jgi:hypothetical protein